MKLSKEAEELRRKAINEFNNKTDGLDQAGSVFMTARAAFVYLDKPERWEREAAQVKQNEINANNFTPEFLKAFMSSPDGKNLLRSHGLKLLATKLPNKPLEIVRIPKTILSRLAQVLKLEHRATLEAVNGVALLSMPYSYDDRRDFKDFHRALGVRHGVKTYFHEKT